MAHVDESLLMEHEENDIKDIVKLQALFRGALVRKWISDTRQMYEDVLNELETSKKISVHWISDKPCYPNLKRKSSKRNADKNVPMKTDSKEAGIKVKEVPKEIGSSFSAKDSHVETKSLDDSHRTLKHVLDTTPCETEPQLGRKISSTVETQTSFCETSRTENFHPTIPCEDERVPTLEQDGNKSETAELTVALDKQSDTPRDNVNTLPFQPETDVKEKNSVVSSESQKLPQDDSTQGESFLNHTADIEHSLFRSMQNKTLNKSDISTEERVKDNCITSEKIADFQFEGPVKDAGHSPVAKGQEKHEENAEKIKSSFPGQSSEDLTSVTMATSVWDSFASSKDQINGYGSPPSAKIEAASREYPRDRESLQELRKNIAMELLWVQQAINSRKNALFRGALVRKWISDTRQMYEDVLNELETSKKISVHWISDKPCYPNLKRKSSKRNADKNVPMKTDSKEAGIKVKEVPKEIGSSFSAKDSHVETKSLDDSHRTLKHVLDTTPCETEPQLGRKISSTVETQTSFCETSRTENFHPTIPCEDERVPTLEQDGNKSETAELTVALDKQSDTPRDNVNTLPFQPETDVKEKNSVVSSESQKLPQDDSTQGESFLNHTADIEHSLFRSMQNKTLNKSDISTEERVKDNCITSEKIADFQFEGPVKDAGHSPVAKGQEKHEENAEKIKSSFPGQSSEDLTSVTMATSVWDSFASSKDQINGYGSPPSAKIEAASREYPRDRESLQELRKNIAMELLWVQQAINSRKNYLRLRSQMKT